jgi:hypothetical protein
VLATGWRVFRSPPIIINGGVAMKRIEGFTKRIIILVLVIAVMVIGVVACGKRIPGTTTDTTYKLTHTAADAEYILSWDSIVSRCPDIGTFEKMEAFVYRGEISDFAPGEPFSLSEDYPAAWANVRAVRTEIVGDSFRVFGVWMWYFETDEELDEYVEPRQWDGLPFQEDGDFVTAVLESEPPTQSVQLHIAGNQFYILFMDIASSDKSLLFGKEKLMELLPTVKSNISLLEITPLPSGIPERKLNEPQNTLSEVKCDGEEYNLVVKPNNAVVLLATSIREQDIADLKSSGLIQEIYEIGRNEKASEDIELNVHFAEFYKGTRLSDGEAWPSCKVVYIAGLPSENLDTFLERLQSYGAYSYHLLSNNTRDKDVRLSFTGKFVE